MKVPQIIDANLNRVSEGLRVIEDYLRFVQSSKELTKLASNYRKKVNSSNQWYRECLSSRDLNKDVRAKEPLTQRSSITDLLIANFKRVTEGLRVLEEYTGDELYNHIRYDIYDFEKTVLLSVSVKPKILKGVYVVSSDVDVLKKAIHEGATMIQLRDKQVSKQVLLDKARDLSNYSKTFECCFIINDYIDIALLVDADGVHTGQDDIDSRLQRQLLGDQKVIGRSTHNMIQAKKAESEGVDYISVGPLWETPSKPGRKAVGMSFLKEVSESISIPYVAIGGIDNSNIADVMAYLPPLVGVIRAHSFVKEWSENYYK